jgi:arylsulfatase A-like enzyme
MKPGKLSIISAFLLSLAFTPIASPAATPHTDQTALLPNVVIIYSDDHGYTDLGIHGIDGNVDTPNMDALAKGGALMKAGYSSAPQCRPSRCGLMTGRIQNEFGFADNKMDAGSGVGTLPRVYPAGTDMAGQPLLTIADRMKKLGYVTGFSGKWHCGPNDDQDKKFDPRGRGSVAHIGTWTPAFATDS